MAFGNEHAAIFMAAGYSKAKAIKMSAVGQKTFPYLKETSEHLAAGKDNKPPRGIHLPSIESLLYLLLPS